MNTEETTAQETTIKRKNKVVAINAKGNLAEALRIHLGSQRSNRNTEFVFIDRLSERPEGASIASLNMPSFIPGTEGVTVTTVGSRMVQNQSQADKSAQWTLLRDPNAPVEEILAELGNPQDYLVVPERAMSEIRLELADLTLDIAEAETEEAKASAYKRGFELLSELVG